MNDASRKPQWEQAADAVQALGGKATRTEVWEYLKRSRPDLPFSTVTADLNAVSVNAPARTSYHTGKKPRRTDSGDRHDRLFKVGVGEGAHYVTYDPAVHGVWEIYPDPAATSTHRTSIRQADAALPTLTVELSAGAIRPGNSFFPVKPLDGGFFPASMLRTKDPDGPGVPAHFTTDAGTAFDSDIYGAANTGYLHNRAAARAYFQARQAKAGDRLRFERRGEGQYHISHLPAASMSAAGDDIARRNPHSRSPAPCPSTASCSAHPAPARPTTPSTRRWACWIRTSWPPTPLTAPRSRRASTPWPMPGACAS